MAKYTRTYFQDPSHGWLKVPRAHLIILGIADQISHYSYQHGTQWAYLEEDSDMSKYTMAVKAVGDVVIIRHKYTDNPSRIRSFESYRSA